MFVAERRGKEMAIRKVMGAASPDVLRKMVAPFLKMMVIACVIGLPFSYYLSRRWLNSYVYKVEVNWTIGILSILLLGMVTILTVSFHSLRVARANPVESLKQE